MALGKGLKGFRLFAVGAIMLAAPATAFAHAHLTSPPSRAGTNDTTIKIAQCGNLPRGTSFVQLEAGAPVKVDYIETVAHQGCYQFRLGDKNDSNWQLLKQVDDPSGSQGAQSTTVNLPSGFKCEACTLQMLQLMNNAPCTANQDPATAAAGVYYSCADIRVGDFPDASVSTDSGTPEEEDDAGGTSSSGGSTTTPTDGGGKTSSSSGSGATSRSLRQSDDGGCNVSDGTTSGLAFFMTTGLAILAVARRRQKKS